MHTASEQAQSNPHAPHTSPAGNVGGLIAEVENKMAELMNWHKQQVSQFEEEKTKFHNETEQQREAIKAQAQQQEQAFQEKADQHAKEIEAQRKSLAQRMDQIEGQRIKLVELTSKLRAQESAISREWGDVQRERDALQKQVTELAALRERTEERAKAWLDTTAHELSQPLKLCDVQEEAEPNDSEHNGEHHHAA